MSKVHQLFGPDVPLTGLRFGCEFELESIQEINPLPTHLFHNCVEDNSLRNNGREFITRPLTMSEAVTAHAVLFDGKLVRYGCIDDVCTDRCSTHIHVNFQDVEEEKVKQFIRLYALIEPLFFKVVSETRQNNIYCVPLSSTTLLRKVLSSSLEHLTEIWHKYAAFNIKPLAQLGTIEFRHFEATPDTAKVSRWLRMIEALYMFNMATEVDLLITDSVLYRLVNAVSDIPYTRDDIYQMCQDTLVNDLLLMVHPTKELLTQRLKQSKETV